MRKLRPIHPGEILREEFLVPLGLSMHKLALALRVPATRIAEIVHGRRGITPETPHFAGLARYFDTTPHFWLNLQNAYDLPMLEDRELEKIKQDVRPLAAAR